MEKRVMSHFGWEKKVMGPSPSIKDKVQLSTITPNFVVARYKNGKIIKGSTYNFNPHGEVFHIVPREKEVEKIFEVSFSELKAVFFVKSLEGRRDHVPSKIVFEEDEKTKERTTVKVTFLDGETMVGTTQVYNIERNGFFIHPLDEGCNNLRVFVMANAIKHLEVRK
jgi:hypothetical protein